MTERVEPLTTEEIAELRRLSDAAGAAEAEAEHLGTNYSNRKAEAAEFHRDKAAGPALARLLDIAEDHAQLVAERDGAISRQNQLLLSCQKAEARCDALRADLTAANARIGKLRATVQAIIEDVAEDERFRSPPALVQVNAPLALIQVELAAKRHTALAALAALDEEDSK